MKTSEMIKLLQKKVERYGDQEVMVNNHRIAGVISCKGPMGSVNRFNIVYENFIHSAVTIGGK